MAGRIRSSLSGAALEARYIEITTTLREILLMPRSLEKLGEPGIGVLAVGKTARTGRALRLLGGLGLPHIYGVVIALPPAWPSPLASSLLYRQIERLTGEGVKAGDEEFTFL